MKSSQHNFIRNFIRCGLAGWCIEVFWTGMGAFFQHDRLMVGNSSLIMFPIYGMAALFAPISQRIKNRNILFRGGVYMICIFAVEYLSGSILRLWNLCPWDYSGAKYSVDGLIRLDYAPAWFVAGLIMESILLHAPSAISHARRWKDSQVARLKSTPSILSANFTKSKRAPISVSYDSFSSPDEESNASYLDLVSKNPQNPL